MRVFMITMAVVMGFAALTFGLNALGMVSWKFFGTWGEQIRYDIHKESQTYRDGMQRNLDGLIAQFNKADAVGRLGIKEAIRHQYSQTDVGRLPAYQQDFLRNTVGLY